MSTIPAATERQAVSLFQRDIIVPALIDSLKKLDPRVQIRNPVMFVVEICSLITTVTWLIQAFGGKPDVALVFGKGRDGRNTEERL